MATEYDAAFFDLIREGCQRSAEAVVPRFKAHYRPRTVVDVGCGEGWWGKAFEDIDCQVTGIDGPVDNPALDDFRVHDLTERLTLPLGFDLAISLEVAEHLPPERADTFVADLCALAPVVLFSAAIPGQGGHGHLNEQWPAYWVERFEANGYECSGALRWDIWDDDRVENWYRQNLMVAADSWERIPELFNDSLGTQMLPVVHPVLYDARRQR